MITDNRHQRELNAVIDAAREQFTLAHRDFSGRVNELGTVIFRLRTQNAALLEALRGLLDSGRGADEIAHALDIPRDRIDQARAAIAEAEKGETV